MTCSNTRAEQATLFQKPCKGNTLSGKKEAFAQNILHRTVVTA
jgi:hypothetical protein